MAQQVEINLRIPSLVIRTPGNENPTKIANDAIRLIGRLEVPKIPKPADILTLTTSTGLEFPATVLTANWDDGKDMFVVACRFGRTRITPAEYQAFVDASDWEAKPLLPDA